MGIFFALNCMIYFLVLTSYPVVTTNNGKKRYNLLAKFPSYFIRIFSSFCTFHDSSSIYKGKLMLSLGSKRFLQLAPSQLAASGTSSFLF